MCGGVDGRLGDAALVLECHVVGGRQRHAGAEDVLDAAALQGVRVRVRVQVRVRVGLRVRVRVRVRCTGRGGVGMR